MGNKCGQLADGTGVEVLTFLDDHSRLAISITAHPVVTGPVVLAQFCRNTENDGPPASRLTATGWCSPPASAAA
ncbi:hypothetical protein ACFFGH_27825 [Lysobacter korlensis]|uniref:Uncharacterized protein n=1 Tax=Lysobacter korlensis TaxID=553636 RepID=A0ABV6RYW0_9GAMM